MSSPAEYLFSYDNQDTSTLSDDVEDAIMDVFEIDKRATYVSRLRDLALVGHSWTPHKRQHVPQEIVLLKPDTYDETLDRYIEAYNDLEKQDIATVALTKFPHILCIDWTLDSPIDALVRNPEFETFAKYYGRLITEMWIFNCDFASAGKLVWIVRRFPRLLSLRVADCVLGVSTLRQARLRYSGCGRTGVPWGLETVSISMRDPAEIDSLYDVMAFVSWLMEEPREDLRSVMLDMAFEFTKEYEEVTRSALYALGPVLVDVSFKLNEAPDTRVPKAISAFPDLSANTRLKSLLFDGLAPGSMPSSYLLSTLSTVTSPSLERLTLIADIFEVDDTSLAFLGLDPLVEHLSSRNNFPSLKLVRLVVVNYAGAECPRGKDMWRFVHERTTLLRQKGVQIKYRLEDPHDAEGPMVYNYSSSSYEKGEYETEMDHEDTSLRGQLLLRSYEYEE